jgi:capsular polysaccharide export protein
MTYFILEYNQQMTGGERLDDAHKQSGEPPKVVLFLQGPASPFLRRVAEALCAQNIAVRKINFCVGDGVFWWPRTGDWYLEPRERWPDYLNAYLTRHAVTDIVMLGDGRPLHAAAIDVAMARGCRVHILEHGYLRPDWLTLEPDGMSGSSRFPSSRADIEALAAGQPDPEPGGRYRSSFLVYALYDLSYHLPNVFFGWLVHPLYRTHGPVHPLVEYAGWIGKAFGRRRRSRTAARSIEAWLAPAENGAAARCFLFPLQLPGDYQIRVHAPGGDLFRLVEATIASFAVHAPPEARLLFKVHPIDNGLSGWSARIAGAASRHGAAGRVFVADGGRLDDLLDRACGVVTVNSTVGLSALLAGKPVIALGAAIYDMDGITHRKSLAAFWSDPAGADPAFFRTFLRALAASTQLRGGFVGREAIREGARNVALRLLEKEKLPPAWRKRRGERPFRHAAELLEAQAEPERAGSPAPAESG